MGIIVTQVSVGGYDKNFSYVVYDVESRNAAIVDPCGDLEKVLKVVEEERLDLVGVLLTHTHHDHVDKLDELLRQYAIPVHVQKLGQEKIISQTPVYGMRDQETLLLGSSQVTVLYTPGHTDDSVCFVIVADQSEDGVPKVLTGDTLFVGGCGRTTKDDVHFLFNSLIRVRALPDEADVFPGHDYGSRPATTIGEEKISNPYLLAKDFDEFKKLRLS